MRVIPAVILLLATIEVAPQSFEELWDDCPAVVRARVVSVAEVEVLEIYKGAAHIRKDAMLPLTQATESTPLRPGAEYLLFLNWNNYTGRWVVRGNNGTFEILENRRLHAYGLSAVAQARDGKTLSSVADELKRLAKR